VTGTPSGNVTYAYDAFGRRMSKTVGSSTTYYLYDGDALIAEVDAYTE
jgi:YD repeat-containing protein